MGSSTPSNARAGERSRPTIVEPQRTAANPTGGRRRSKMHRFGWSFPLLLGLLFAAMPAFAQGINLRWTECVADGGMRNATFACNTNSGQRVLVTSFVLPGPVTGSPGVSGVIDIIAADVTLPDWWNFRACRSGSILATLSTIAPVLCGNVYGNCDTHVGISAILPGVPAVNGERLQFSRTFCNTFPPPIIYPNLSPGVEYIGIPLTINFTRTSGSPSCGGCSTPVCVTLTQLQVAA